MDLLDLLSTTEARDLKEKIRAKEARKSHDKKARKAARLKSLEEKGLLDNEPAIFDWVPKETLTVWRTYECRCGATYEGPAYDCNPTWLRLEKMRVRTFSVQAQTFVDLKTPRPMKGNPSVWRRADYSSGLPHRLEVQNCQLWSCRQCQAKVKTTSVQARPWAPGVPSDTATFDDPGDVKDHTPIPTYGELNLKTSPTSMSEAYAEFGLETDD